MADDSHNVRAKVDRVRAHAVSMHEVANKFRSAAADMANVEAARLKLDAIRGASSKDSTVTKLAIAFKDSRLKVDETIQSWDADGSGIDVETFCREAEALGVKASTTELRTIFSKVCGKPEVDASEKLEVPTSDPEPPMSFSSLSPLLL